MGGASISLTEIAIAQTAAKNIAAQRARTEATEAP